jgi:hypothetical protein
VVEVLSCLSPGTLSALTPQSLTLGGSAAWLLPGLLDRSAAALPALASVAFDAICAPAVMRRLYEERGLLARLTRLKVLGWGPLELPLPSVPHPEQCPGGMRMEDLQVGEDEPTPLPAADAAALAAWPMPRLRRLALALKDLAALRALLRAPWAAGLEDLHLSGPCLRRTEGACGDQGV